jgi:hypothetical protein
MSVERCWKSNDRGRRQPAVYRNTFSANVDGSSGNHPPHGNPWTRCCQGGIGAPSAYDAQESEI